MENLGIDPKLMIAQLINFGLFFFIIKKFVAKPFMSFLDEERQKEKEKLKLQEQMVKQEEAFQAKQKNLEKKMREELENALKGAKDQAAKIKVEMLEEAKAEAQTLKENAKKELESEKDKMYREIKSKVSDLSLIIVNKALMETLDSDTKKKVSQKILSSLSGKSADLYEN
ncbi:MAG: ATP synthase F0 subunit B [Patescibacteria group bacterium]